MSRILIAQLTPSGVKLLETAEKVARVIEKRGRVVGNAAMSRIDDGAVELVELKQENTGRRCLAES